MEKKLLWTCYGIINLLEENIANDLKFNQRNVTIPENLFSPQADPKPLGGTSVALKLI